MSVFIRRGASPTSKQLALSEQSRAIEGNTMNKLIQAVSTSLGLSMASILSHPNNYSNSKKGSKKGSKIGVFWGGGKGTLYKRLVMGGPSAPPQHIPGLLLHYFVGQTERPLGLLVFVSPAAKNRVAGLRNLLLLTRGLCSASFWVGRIRG